MCGDRLSRRRDAEVVLDVAPGRVNVIRRILGGVFLNVQELHDESRSGQPMWQNGMPQSM
jgi:hypothetical protein